MEELLIGFGIEGYIKIVDLYGFDGEQAVQLMDDPSLGDRSNLSLLSDGTLYLFGGSGVMEGDSHEYYRLKDTALLEASYSAASEITDIPWQSIAAGKETALSFDAVLADIQTALSISTADYDANMDHYDAQYSHLGEGVLWMLLHRESGVYTMCIWNITFDIDGDGVDELVIGRGVSLSSVEPIVIYKHNGEVTYGDALYAYADLFYGGAPMEWNYLGG